MTTRRGFGREKNELATVFSFPVFLIFFKTLTTLATQQSISRKHQTVHIGFWTTKFPWRDYSQGRRKTGSSVAGIHEFF